MKKVLAIMALMFVVLSIGTAVIQASNPGTLQCHRFCLDTAEPTLDAYKACFQRCMGVPE